MTAGEPPRARVTIEPRRLWTLRASLSVTRWLLYGVAVAGIAATVRDAVAPAGAAPAREPVRERVTPVPAAAGEWFALRFARAYLTWSPDPTGREHALEPFLASALSADAGLAPAAGTSEAVAWVAIAAARPDRDGAVDYTVAAGMAGGAVRYLALAVGRGAGGAYTLERYPALVGAPAPAPAGRLGGGGLAALADPSLAAVLERALGNYVGASPRNLAADLAPGAVVQPVAPGLTLRSVVRLAVAGPHEVLATVLAGDGAGGVYTLAYEVAVAQVGGRWEITRIGS